MTVIARFEVLPTGDGRTAERIAEVLQVLDQFPVTYETTATDTVIEADDVGDVFAAAQAAHRAIPDDRVITSLEVDEVRDREQHIGDRVQSVEQALGRPPRRIRHPVTGQQSRPAAGQTAQQQQGRRQQTQPQQVAGQQRQPGSTTGAQPQSGGQGTTPTAGRPMQQPGGQQPMTGQQPPAGQQSAVGQQQQSAVGQQPQTPGGQQPQSPVGQMAQGSQVPGQNQPPRG